MKFNVSNGILKDKLNAILRQLNSSSFIISVFKGVEPNNLFVILNLSNEDLEKEATAIGFLTKSYRLSAKIPFQI